MNRYTLAIVLFAIIVIGLIALVVIPAPEQAHAPTVATSTPDITTPATSTPTTTPQASLPDLITVSSPLPGTVIHSPLTITGKARGGWYFEASAPVELRDSVGKVIAQGHVEAQGDWMTAEYVTFKGTLTFTAPATSTTGTLVLMNDNPSGLPENQKELDIPVKFK
ncbi:MAG: hypothetical protein JWO43_54 [Candidatus Adlerbacteria bacterium]|nr:hypothetical protein [Candidatus Adlerbacteria bacterium]